MSALALSFESLFQNVDRGYIGVRGSKIYGRAQVELTIFETHSWEAGFTTRRKCLENT